jgi:hypothetical protein
MNRLIAMGCALVLRGPSGFAAAEVVIGVKRLALLLTSTPPLSLLTVDWPYQDAQTLHEPMQTAIRAQ